MIELYFKRRDVWEFIEQLVDADVEGLFPSLTQTVLDISVVDNLLILEELVELDVLYRKFLQIDGEDAIEVDADSITDETKHTIYIKYMFTDMFVKELKSKNNKFN